MTFKQRKREFSQDLRSFVSAHGWVKTANVLRAEIFRRVGFDSDFTELDNVLRKIADVPMGEVFPPNEPDIPVSSLEPPEHHFS